RAPPGAGVEVLLHGLSWSWRWWKRPVESANLRFGEPAAASARSGLLQPYRCGEATVVKVIASSVRKGNVLDVGGKLCVVMKAENIHPGKGTPVTHLDMRRISDGVKITERYRTTDQVERAYLEDKTYNYLYEDDMGFHFMEPETFEQIQVPKDIIGDQSV